MKKLSIFLILLSFTTLAISQNGEITGTVYAFNKYPLKKISITAKKSKQEVLTNENGEFKIGVKKNDVLIINADAFEGFRYKVQENERKIKINLIVGHIPGHYS